MNTFMSVLGTAVRQHITNIWKDILNRKHCIRLMMGDIDHISICICTYKRPVLLARLLENLRLQESGDLFTYSIVVVDNDYNLSAKDIVESARQASSVRIQYFTEPDANISLARNRAIEEADGNYIAFIDDDEFPENNWLLNLYITCRKYSADGVLGPVKPYFEGETPIWVIKGKLWERKYFRTGHVIKSAKDTRTGNVLLNMKIFEEGARPFDPRFGRTGGEDIEFFGRMIRAGRVFVWCNEALVHESIQPQRSTRTYFLKRALLRGEVVASRSSLLDLSTVKSVIAIALYTLALPFLLLMGHHFFMKYLIKICDHSGKLLAYCGIKIVKERTYL